MSPMSSIAEVIASQVESQHWIWRMKVLSDDGWKRICSCSCHWDKYLIPLRNAPDYCFPIWQSAVAKGGIRYIYLDPVTGERVDDREACRRQLLRTLT